MDTVLIVDDSSFIVEGLMAFLKKKYRPLAAHGGAECLEILKRETPSVIILDIMMDPMDGWETLAHIKENPETRYIPVLMFSALKISPEEAEEHRISLDDCLTKPVSPNKIIEAIEKVLSRRDTHRMIVERWQSSGISQEKIDEYLSLVARLEVDLSLCQNMKVQDDLVRQKDTNHEEFRAVIRGIEERILKERDQIEIMAREMNEILARGGDIREPGAPVHQSPEPGEPVLLSSSPAVSGDESVPGPASASLPPELPLPGGPETSGAISGPEVVPVQELTTAPEAGPVPAVPGGIPDISVPEGHRGYDNGDPGSPVPADGPAGNEADRATEQEQDAISVIPAPGPVPSSQELPVLTERNVIPANPDLARDIAGISSKNGAGTDVPMPWDTGRDRKSRTAVPAPEQKDEPGKPAPPQPVPGILARILSLVSSLFSRRT